MKIVLTASFLFCILLAVKRYRLEQAIILAVILTSIDMLVSDLF